MFSAEAMSNFLIALEVMGLGMLSIFVVMAVLILIVTLLTRLNIGGKKKDQDNS